ncbi:MAG: PDZ domain-containing protein [Cyanobacteria bacterium SZAS TMP-1]|nr:PDZ domain-containing protein [Cyanobacteria bacterium SZAS TMP-1]
MPRICAGLTLCISTFSMAAGADSGPALLPAEPVLDTSTPAKVPDSKPEPISVQGDPVPKLPQRVLNGGVTHSDKLKVQSNQVNQAGPSVHFENLPQLSSDEYRKLEYGIIGFNAELRFNVKGPVVTSVFPSCPAANAGILPGDVLIQAGDHVFQNGEGQDVLWKVVGGKADTPLDVVVMRGLEPLSFHLTRMNIEDIKDANIRGYYEKLLGSYGPPGESQR